MRYEQQKMKFIDSNLSSRKEPVGLYFAYGMNTNHDQMKMRCPNAIFIGHGILQGAKLVFRSVADYEYSRGHSLHGSIWLISKDCEKALDRLEGYPSLYDKEIVEAFIKYSSVSPYKDMKGAFKMMIYKMNSERISSPPLHYWSCLAIGYKQSRLPFKQLSKALEHAKREQQPTSYSWTGKQKARNKINLFSTRYEVV
jgi:gamma-glutamylcyclotransferase (GGCT)/AIG2-like uncharacterized protein YtfP